MLIWFVAGALAGPEQLDTVELAKVDGCVVAEHSVTVACKKGACTLDETLTLQEPTCKAKVQFDGEALDGGHEPLVETASGSALPMPCGDDLCVSGLVHPIRVSRVVPVSEVEGLLGFVLVPDAVTPTVETSFGQQSAFEGEDGLLIAVSEAGELKKPPVLKPSRDAKTAKPTSVDYYGPVDKGLRDGLWEERHYARHPISRQVTYDRGVRVDTGPWEAHTVVDDEGVARRVPQLAACPRDANIETMSGGLITQSCTWNDDEGSHALVASFRVEPWQLVSLGEALNGRRHGEAREFWPDGSLRERSTFYEGNAVGISEQWHESGERSGSIHYRFDGGVQGLTEWSAEGVVTREAERVPGMGANLWDRRYESGRLTEERLPIDALTTEIQSFSEGTFQLAEESISRTPPPDGQCFADVDCDSGICLKNACVATADPSSWLDGLESYAAPAEALTALDEHGRKAFVPAAAFGGDTGCTEVNVRPGTALSLLATAGDLHRAVGLGSADADGALFDQPLTPLTASCVEHTEYLECGDGGFQACENSALRVHAEGTEPSLDRRRPPRRVSDCGLECGTRVCAQEAGRVRWLLRDRYVVSGKAEPLRLFWDRATCEGEAP